MTLSALFAALCVISLFIASVWPTGRLALTAISSLFVAAAVIEGGIKSGIAVFAISAALGMLIVPNRASPLLFILFLGYYPAAKSLIEHLKGNILQWVLKLALFNAALMVLWFLFRELVPALIAGIDINNFVIGGFGVHLMGALILSNIVFVIFDYGYTKLIWFYINRVSQHKGRL